MNEFYQMELRCLFFLKLEEMQPKLVEELEHEVFPLYKSANANYEVISDSDGLRDIVNFPEEYSSELFNFAKRFSEWIFARKLDEEWIINHLLRLFHLKSLDGLTRHLWHGLEADDWLPEFDDFEFSFEAWNIAMTPENYFKNLEAEFQKQKKEYFEKVNNELHKNSVTKKPVTKNIEAKHMSWLVTYYFNSKISYESIAVSIQRNLCSEESAKTKNDIGSEGVRKAVTELAEKLPLKLRSKKAT